MSCLELRYNKHGETKIIKITTQSESDSDWDLLFEFLMTGILPKDINIQSSDLGKDIGAARQDLLNYLSTELEKSAQPLHTYMLFDKRGGFKTKEDVINKIIGNKDIQSVLYDTYLDDMFAHNCLYISGWGAKTWYGFTSERPLMITGRAQLYQNPTENTLFTSYYELRQGSEFVLNTINKLFDKYKPYETDNVYDKLTWLANNQLGILVDALYIPQYKAIETQELRSELSKNFSDYVGHVIKYNNQLYVIKKKGSDNTIIVTKVKSDINEKNEDIEIPRNAIRYVYDHFTVQYKGKTFYLFNKTWHIKEKGQYLAMPKSLDLSNELFNVFFGVTDNDVESIDVFHKSLNVTLYSIVPNTNLTVAESLSEGSYVRTSSGYFTKDSDGQFKNGDEVLASDAKIYKIFYKKESEIDTRGDLFKNFLSLNSTRYTLNEQDALIILSELFDIDANSELWSHIRFSYSDSNTKVKQINDEIVLEIGLKGGVTQEKAGYQLKLAMALFKNLYSDSAISTLEFPLLDFWYGLEDFAKKPSNIFKHRKKERELTPVEQQILQNLVDSAGSTNDVNPNEWEETVEKNREAVSKTIFNDNGDEWDAFIDELINKGLYIMSCKL